MKSYEKTMSNNCQFICWKVNRRVTNFFVRHKKKYHYKIVVVSLYANIHTYIHFSLVSFLPFPPNFHFFFLQCSCVLFKFVWLLLSFFHGYCEVEVFSCVSAMLPDCLFSLYFVQFLLVAIDNRQFVALWQVLFCSSFWCCMVGGTQIQFHCIYKY